MKNLAIIPDILFDAEKLLNSVCSHLSADCTHDEILYALSSNKKSIKSITRKASPLIRSLSLEAKIEEKYLEIKNWSMEQHDIALPVIAWKYFTYVLLHSDEDSVASNVIAGIPIVDRSFTDYFLSNH